MEKRVSLGNINFNYFITMTTLLSTIRKTRRNFRLKLNFPPFTHFVFILVTRQHRHCHRVAFWRFHKLTTYITNDMNDFSIFFFSYFVDNNWDMRKRARNPIFVCQFDFRWFHSSFAFISSNFIVPCSTRFDAQFTQSSLPSIPP